MKWISEADQLPPIAQPVFYTAPRQSGEFWDTTVARLLVHYEGVCPRPVKAGDQWPTTYHWSHDHFSANTSLVTGNGWWAWMDDIPLPPGAEHRKERGQHYIAQIGECFVPMKSK